MIEATVEKFVAGADCVWHNAAAVGPFHPRALYFEVNYQGTLNVLRAGQDRYFGESELLGKTAAAGPSASRPLRCRIPTPHES